MQVPTFFNICVIPTRFSLLIVFCQSLLLIDFFFQISDVRTMGLPCRSRQLYGLPISQKLPLKSSNTSDSSPLTFHFLPHFFNTPTKQKPISPQQFQTILVFSNYFSYKPKRKENNSISNLTTFTGRPSRDHYR